MGKIDWKIKLSSRKFWVAVAGFVVGVMALLGSDSTLTQQVSGIILAFGSMVAYIAGEGYVDGQSAANTTGAQMAITQPPEDGNASET